MNKKIAIIFALVFLAFLVMGTASAGIFDIFGGDEVQNQTYDFGGFSLDIPEDAVVVNETTEENGLLLDTFVVTLADGDSYIVEKLSGNIVSSMDDFKINAGTLGAKFTDEYGNWTVFDMKNVDTGDDVEYHPYMLAQHDGEHIYQLEGKDLDSLKSLADTFKAE